MSAAIAGLVPVWRLASHQRPRLAFQKVSPLYQRILLGGLFISEDPLHGGGRRGLIIKPCPLSAQISCTFSTTSFSSVQFKQAAGEVRGCPQQAPVAPKHLISCANQPLHASVSGRVDNGSICCRDYEYARTELN